MAELYQEEQNLKTLGSEVIQAKLGAVDIYSSFFN